MTIALGTGETTMTAADARRLIAEYTDAVWNRGNIEATARYYAAGYRHHDVSRPDVQTLTDYQAWGRALLAAFPGMQVDIDDLIAEEGGRAVKRWTARGTHAGELAGIPPTGKSVAFSGVSIYRFENGRIVESWYVYDLFGLLQQLGAIPTPAASDA